MKIGVLGTGMVGRAIATRLVELGHDVRMGARDAANESARAWTVEAGARSSAGTFADAAAFGELIVHATRGDAALAALALAGADNLAGKPLVDVSNALEFPPGQPPFVQTSPSDSLGERIQRAFPAAKVVKALNTMNCGVMIDPALVAGEHDVFICGNAADAKERVRALLAEIGWKSIIDLGDITNARATEALVVLWIRLRLKSGTSAFNLHVVTGDPDAARRLREA